MKALYPYQEATVARMLTLGGRGAILHEMGTGKTLCALEVAKRLGCQRILVVCPLAVATVWDREVRESTDGWLYMDATIGSVPQRADIMRQLPLTPAPTLITVGYESYWRKAMRDAITAWKPDLIIYDEGHRLKGRTSKQAKFAHWLRDYTQHVLVLTGTPMPNGAQDMFSIFKAIRPDVFGDRWADFEDDFLRVTKRSGFPQIIGYKDRDEFERRVHTASVRVTKAEATDLPEEVDAPMHIPLVGKSKQAYAILRKNAVAEIDGLDGETGTVISNTMLTNVIRLMQITSGFVKLNDTRIIDVGSEKEDAVLGLLEDILPRRVVVFAHFTHDVERIARACAAVAPTFTLSGAVKQEQRRLNIEAFNAAPSAVLVCQIAVAALGIDLTASDSAIFYSVDYDLMHYSQARARLHRIGQTNKVTHYLLIARHTIDERVHKALAKKEQLSTQVLDVSAARELLLDTGDDVPALALA